MLVIIGIIFDMNCIYRTDQFKSIVFFDDLDEKIA